MTCTRAWMNNLLSPLRATEDPNCFVDIDIPDSFRKRNETFMHA